MKPATVLLVGKPGAATETLAQSFEVACVGTTKLAAIYMQEHCATVSALLIFPSCPDGHVMGLLSHVGAANGPAVPCLVITDDPKVEQDAFAHGAWDVLPTTMDMQRMCLRLESAIRKNQASSAEPEVPAAGIGLMQRQMQHIVDSIPGGIAVYRMSDRFETLYFSDGIAHLTGHTRQEYAQQIGDDASAIVFPSDRARIQANAMKALQSNKPIDVLYRIIHKDGSLVWVRLNAMPMEQTEQGTLVYAIIQAVSPQTELYQQILDEIKTAVYVCDTHTHELIFVNKVLAQHFGVSPSEMIGKKCHEYMFKRDIPCTFCRSNELSHDRFLEREYLFPKDNHTYHISGKLFDWNNQAVHVEFIDDITAQRRSEQQNAQLLNQLTSLVDNVPGALSLYHVMGQTLVPIIHNKAFFELVGRTTTALEVQDISAQEQGIHPDDVLPLQLAILEALKKENNFRQIFRLYSIQKEQYIWIRMTAHCVLQEDGTKLAYCIYSDITDVKEAEQIAIVAKDRAERLYQRQLEVIETIDNTDFIARGQSNLTQDALVSFNTIVDLGLQIPLGTTYDKGLELLSQRIADPSQAQYIKEHFNRDALLQMFAKGETEATIDCQWTMGDGTVQWLSTVHRMVQQPQTNDIISFIYCYDITTKKMMQDIVDTIIRLDYGYLAVLDCSNNSFQLFNDKQGKPPMTESLDYEQAIVAYAKEHLIPEDVDRVVRELSIKNITAQLSKTQTFTFYFTMKDENNTDRRMRAQYTTLDTKAKKVLITSVDVTAIYETEQARMRELQQSIDAANRANNAKTDFLSRMSHDIRTPLNAVIGLANLGLTSKDYQEMETYFHEIGVSGNYLLSIINDVLDMSKIENKALVLHPKVVFIPKFISETLAVIKPSFVAKHISMEVKQMGITSLYMRFDETYMRQVAVNLLSNAVKFTPEGGHVELVLENLSRNGKFVTNRMTVRDSGIGISPQFLPKLFTPFEQENESDDTSRQGTGLGLAIVQSIVKLMNGTIKVESTKGQGTSFIIEWVLETVSPEAGAAIAGTQTAPDCSLAGKHVLLCEDQPLNAKIAIKLLEREQIKVTLAHNGEQGVRIFSESPIGCFDAILMDIRMPVMDGLQATQAIRDLPRPDAQEIPIIAMSANAFEDDAAKSLAAGMQEHLTKPMEPRLLFDTLRRYIH